MAGLIEKRNVLHLVYNRSVPVETGEKYMIFVWEAILCNKTGSDKPGNDLESSRTTQNHLEPLRVTQNRPEPPKKNYKTENLHKLFTS